MGWRRKDFYDLGGGLAFLLPNICGFLLFMAIPLVMSLVMAFSNWNLELHRMQPGVYPDDAQFQDHFGGKSDIWMDLPR